MIRGGAEGADWHKTARDYAHSWGPAILQISKIPPLMKSTNLFPQRPKPVLCDPGYTKCGPILKVEMQ